MDLAVSHEDTEILLKDKNVLQESVLDKYRTAGQISQTALKYVTGLINDMYHFKNTDRQLRIEELCLLTDSFMMTRLEQYYKHKVNERGIAIPTTIDVNQIESSWCPEIDDIANLEKWNKDQITREDAPYHSVVQGLLKEGDVVKITLGVHIDGYTSEVSHTMVIYPVDNSIDGQPKPAGPLLGGKADAVAATYIAMEAVVSLLACSLTPEKLPASFGSAVNGYAIRSIVDTIARSYNCAVVPGSRVRRIRRFLAGQNEGIVAEREYKGVIWTESHEEAKLLANTEVKDIAVSQPSVPRVVSAVPTDDFVVKAGETYLIDLKFAPLENLDKKGLVILETVDAYTGKSHRQNQLIARSGAYLRDYAQSHTLKLKTSRQLLTKIDNNGVYPFKLSHLSSAFPISKEGNLDDQLAAISGDLKSFRLGMSEISNNYLCVEKPIQVAQWVPWEHILKSNNPNGNLSYDASAALTLPGHDLPLPKLGMSALKLKAVAKSTRETVELPVIRECSTVILCADDVGVNGRPEVLRATGGSKTCATSWVHSVHEMNKEDPIVQGIFQLGVLSQDKRFGLNIRETQPMKHRVDTPVNDAMEL
ncbi:putative hydrolase KNAG_0H03060 [Huiozyma naganishii CBS 8797]|uniref:Probable metalloprotease ARX1 n=1 Tax=Huiozyma naganishii (strain ATCC MYA-139 / BCRC 22969 / CBS 8797 / KCTC 17520 / NBRC 10181 / NCYC 3082 / Yp74L-3) TaxID=1071383 RepID=J7S9U7_HUIN7|nr:hypothetical protein KNAG_0H03060 [Kazachstania naganishii CBS 8797]CCK71721.1 hypothetical protein KNAG_0H03060 [Kazachstania naganishii CBS 8797]